MNKSLFDLNDVLFETIEKVTDHKLKGKALKEELERARTVIAGSEVLVKTGMLAAALYRLADNSKSEAEPIRKLLGYGGGAS
jgi:hypothetical protein